MRGDSPATPQQTTGVADPVALAAEVFAQLEGLRPLHIPGVRQFSDEDALNTWRGGGKMPELLADEFFQWMQGTRMRLAAIAENKRRLRTSMWAEATLVRHGHGDFAEHLAEFHRAVWKVPCVPAECSEREAVVCQVVKYLSGGAR